MISANQIFSIFAFRNQLTCYKFSNYSKYFFHREGVSNVSKFLCPEINSSSRVRRPLITLSTGRHPSSAWNNLFNCRKSRFYLGRTFSKESGSPDDSTEKPLNDEEFQNILKDFARDFGVGNESEKILDDIRKNNEYPEEKETVSDTTKETLDVYQSIAEDRFKEFKDKDSNIIYSFEEEQKFEDEDFFHIDQEYDSHVIKHQVKRGVTGVYDIEELIPILREEKLFDISVIQIPPHLHYADYLVLSTAKSLRHARAVTEFVYKFYKMKKNSKDSFLKIEGEKLGNWKAMDMGNIVLHVFLEDTRALYDLESLWLLDAEYDSGGAVEEDSVLSAMQEELDFLNCLNTEETTDSGQETTK